MRLIDADKIVYSWQIDADGQEHDGVTLESIIDKMPTIEPERKTGKWIRTRTTEHDGELYCDQCGQEHPEQKLIWNFCPNCGAKMEADE